MGLTFSEATLTDMTATARRREETGCDSRLEGEMKEEINGHAFLFLHIFTPVHICRL